jgi:hypothetical protein
MSSSLYFAKNPALTLDRRQQWLWISALAQIQRVPDVVELEILKLILRRLVSWMKLILKKEEPF